jgi:UPF0755 protein
MKTFSKTFIKIFLGLSLAYVIGLFSLSFAVSRYYAWWAASSFTVTEKLLEIPYGSSLRRVSLLLQEANIIKNPRAFYWYMRLGRNDQDRIQAGYYKFSGLIDHRHIAHRLLKGVDRSLILTFREGETIKDLANNLDGMGLLAKEDFLKAMTSEEIISLIKAPNAEARKALENDVGGIEGYLFPDTYFFSKKDSAASIIRKMHERLQSRLDEEIKARLLSLGMSLHEVLTLASIIEKETGDPKERALISSVYHNRIKARMRLQADPTVIYGMKNYQGKIAKADLLAFHSYNTYKILGLPPGPIASPGLLAIRAALWPEETRYLYFVSNNDGTHEFCETITCHNKAVKKWQIDYFKALAR